MQHRSAPRLQRRDGRGARTRRPHRAQDDRARQRRLRPRHVRRRGRVRVAGGAVHLDVHRARPRGGRDVRLARVARVRRRAHRHLRARGGQEHPGGCHVGRRVGGVRCREGQVGRLNSDARVGAQQGGSIRGGRRVHHGRVRGDRAVQGGSLDRRAGGVQDDQEQGLLVRVLRGYEGGDGAEDENLLGCHQVRGGCGEVGEGAPEERGGRAEASARGGARDGEAADEASGDSQDQAPGGGDTGDTCSPPHPRARLCVLMSVR